MNDNEVSASYFNKPEYVEQEVRENITKCSTENISNTKRVEYLNWLENLDSSTCSFCQAHVGMAAEEAKCCKECNILKLNFNEENNCI